MEAMESRAEKILDPELLRFADADAAAHPRSVIVELDAGPAHLTPRRLHAPPRRALDRAKAAPRTQSSRVRRDMTRLQKKLSDLGVQRVVRLDSAQAFVVEVQPAALRAISEMPLVGTIRPNRTHRVPPRG